MRFPHWIKTVASALLLSASAGPAMAQDAGQPMFQPAYGTNDPGVMYPQGVPYGYQPYPAISPYQMGNIGWDQTYQDGDGLWMRRMLWQDREWFGSLDMTYNRIKNPGSRHLGSAYVPFDQITNGPQGFIIPTYGQGGTPGTGTGNNQNTGASSLPTSRVVIDKRVWPYPYLTPSNGTTTTFINNDLFPIRSLDAFGDTKGYGMQGNFGFFNEDGSGWSAGVFWTGPWQQNFTMGEDKINGVPITQAMILSLDGSLLFTRNGAIPLDWGFQDTSGISGAATNLGTAKYDLLFHYDVKSQVIGSDTNYYMTPVVQRPAFKLRPLIGARYLNISEQFHFRGIDSGFGYNLTNSQSTAGNGGGGGGGNGTTTAVTFRPDPNTLQINYDMVEALMTNNVRSNLAGPQIGLRYDFGDGDEFKFWGQSVVGLMANREDFSQWGNNIGDESTLLTFSTGIDMLANDARFRSSRTINHVSPLFEQTFMAEAQIIDMIPLIRNLTFLENTVFRCGYSATFVGDVARAGESIDWKGYPKTPSIHPHRDWWFTSRWNFGLEKRF